MDHLARPTEMIRATVAQEARAVLKPCTDPGVRCRRVQLLVPNDPQLFAALDITPEELGPNRTYKIPLMAPGAALVFHMTNEQYLVLASGQGLAYPTLIVEYLA